MSRLIRGFTLPELLVVLVIAGVLTTLASPLISNAMPGLRTRVAAYEILSDLRETRNTAILKSRTIDIVFDLNNHYMSIAADRRELHDDVEYRVLDSRSQSRGPGRDRSQYRLQFFPDGSSSGMQLRLGDSDSGYDVSVGWLMGRIAISEARNHAP